MPIEFDVDHFPEFLQLPRCPHCNIAQPSLRIISQVQTTNHLNQIPRFWGSFWCASCGGVVLEERQSGSRGWSRRETYPAARGVAQELPATAQRYLQPAIDSLVAPDGAAVMAASAVDAMLKARGLVDGKLNARIRQAASEHLITDDMADWAHEVRMGANDVRHADAEEPHKTPEEARRLVDFAVALGDFLFVFPARVAAGRAERET